MSTYSLGIAEEVNPGHPTEELERAIELVPHQATFAPSEGIQSDNWAWPAAACRVF
jgi:hypothetical protein